MNMFEDIEREKKDLPKIKSLTSEAQKYDLNMYQKFAVLLFFISIIVGIILGNSYNTCSPSITYGSENCISQFDFSLMLEVWFAGLMVGMVFFGIGHIVYLLSDISRKLTK